jgi:hypothetical protein
MPWPLAAAYLFPPEARANADRVGGIPAAERDLRLVRKVRFRGCGRVDCSRRAERIGPDRKR